MPSGVSLRFSAYLLQFGKCWGYEGNEHGTSELNAYTSLLSGSKLRCQRSWRFPHRVNPNKKKWGRIWHSLPRIINSEKIAARHSTAVTIVIAMFATVKHWILNARALLASLGNQISSEDVKIFSPLADECLDVHVQPPSPENTPRPSFDVKTVSCNTSGGWPWTVKRTNFSTGGRGGGIFWELKFQRVLFFCSHFFAGDANFNLKIIYKTTPPPPPGGRNKRSVPTKSKRKVKKKHFYSIPHEFLVLFGHSHRGWEWDAW